MSPPNAAWNEFWANNQGPNDQLGCLPAGSLLTDAAQHAWDGFAKGLPKSARVLDLATGDGRVMRWLQATRRDLKLTGVDMADRLPEAPRGTKLKAGVRMEALPFPHARFDAVTSQFGFEYGKTAAVAKEAARVLRTGGALAILTHRKDGPILAHNLRRREHIRWAIGQKDLPDIAKRSLRLRQSGISVVPKQILQAPEEGARIHGPQSAAWEIAEAIKRSLVLGMHDHPANVARLIDTIAMRAQNELDRITSLEFACENTADEKTFEGRIAAAGFETVSHVPLHVQGEFQAIADFRQYRLR